MQVDSEPGRGTTMRLYLPCPLGEAAPEHRTTVPALLAPAAFATAGVTVLVVEDEAMIRMLVVEALEEIGCRVLEVADGPAELDILHSDARIDLLLTDVGLPGGMNGRQLADAARERRPGLPVLFMTGYAHDAALGNGAALEPGMELMTNRSRWMLSRPRYVASSRASQRPAAVEPEGAGKRQIAPTGVDWFT